MLKSVISSVVEISGLLVGLRSLHFGRDDRSGDREMTGMGVPITGREAMMTELKFMIRTVRIDNIDE